MLETDISIELFNKCAGSCTGCMLSLEERQVVSPLMSPNLFDTVLKRINEHGEKIGAKYRPVLVFGDFPSMEISYLEQFMETLKSNNMKFGFTLTLVDTNKREHYLKAIDLILNTDDTVVFDYTIDPFRMLKDQKYVELIKETQTLAPKYHLQVLLSEAIISRFEPQQLKDIVFDGIGEGPTTLGFAPSLSNLDKKNYGYKVSSAADWAYQFYQSHPLLKAHLKREIERFDSDGEFSSMLEHYFHIGYDANIYPVSFTMFGDVIMDRRNNSKGLGSIEHTPISEIISTQNLKVQKLSSLNGAFMDSSPFNCQDCKFYESCKFSGVGIIRKHYKSFENKTGSCYGPIDFVRK